MLDDIHKNKTKLKQKKKYKKKDIFNLWPKESSPNFLSEPRLWWGTGPSILSSPFSNCFPQILNANSNIKLILQFPLHITLEVLFPLPQVHSQILSTWRIPIHIQTWQRYNLHFEAFPDQPLKIILSPILSLYQYIVLLSLASICWMSILSQRWRRPVRKSKMVS